MELCIACLVEKPDPSKALCPICEASKSSPDACDDCFTDPGKHPIEAFGYIIYLCDKCYIEYQDGEDIN